jgi:hypothetical protein
METFNPQFDECLTRVNIDPAAASKAHKEVRTVLEGDEQLRKWGIDTILIGSYARDVSIRPCNDVDVFAKLPLCRETNPEIVFTAIQKPLQAYYKGRAKEARRSMTISGFSDGLSVDAVPAVPDGTNWKIPQTDKGRTKNQWETTNPERLQTLAKDMNRDSPQVNGRGSYVPVVKLMRQIRAHHMDEARPGGLYCELLTYWAFRSGLGATTYAQLLAEILSRAAAELASGQIVRDPALNSPFAPPPTGDELAAAATVFRDLAADAGAALTMDKCPAAAKWRRILGRNPGGPVFVLPEGCDESGKKLTVVGVNRDPGSNEARPFA